MLPETRAAFGGAAQRRRLAASTAHTHVDRREHRHRVSIEDRRHEAHGSTAIGQVERVRFVAPFASAEKNDDELWRFARGKIGDFDERGGVNRSYK